MKRIVSVSIGSSDRNHKATVNILGDEIVLERVGTDGDIRKAIDIIRELDGKVDAFGMGGIDLYMAGAGCRYVFREAKAIARAARVTPIVDGTSLKSSLEYRVVKYIAEGGQVPIRGKRVFLACAMDRVGMGEAFEELGCEVVYGDLMFALGIPIPIRSIATVKRLGLVFMPVITQLPFKWLYPTGKSQEKAGRRYRAYYDSAHVLAGDFHFVRKHLPDRIDGKVVITNTVTPKDVDELGKRGASVLVTTTPEINGRSFGTNVLEAMLVTMIGKHPDDITSQEYMAMLDKLEIRPRIVNYGEHRPKEA